MTDQIDDDIIFMTRLELRTRYLRRQHPRVLHESSAAFALRCEEDEHSAYEILSPTRSIP